MLTYNTTHQFTKVLPDLSQDQIYNCPEYFAMSCEEIIKAGCPEFLKQTLEAFPWKDRPNVIQVRPQDFRGGKPVLLGDGWHVDVNARLNDGKVRVAKHIDDFRLLVCSFGGVVGTDFIKTPMSLPDLCDPNVSHGHIFGNVVPSQHFEYHQGGPCQLTEYTSRDIHRMGQHWKTGRLRLMIVAFESDEVVADGIVLPTIRAKSEDPSKPWLKLEDYSV